MAIYYVGGVAVATATMQGYTAAQSEVIAQEQALLRRLRGVLDLFPTASDDDITLRDVSHALDDLFSVVIVGEFNAGKSAFINALLGRTVMEEGATPTTTRINLLRHGDTTMQSVNADGFVVVTDPASFLSQVSVVDTPGTNAVIREHEAVTQQFIPRADLILFVTSADRPFSESERQFMANIRAWGKKVVIVLNKVDLLSEADLGKVLTFVREQVRALLGFTPEIFPVAARLALAAKQSPPGTVRDSLWERSRFEVLEAYIVGTLDISRRLRLKLQSPLGVSERVLGRYRDVANERLALLGDDRETLARIEGQLDVYGSDMERDFAYYLTKIDNIILELQARGDRFLADTLRIGRIPDLLNSERTRGAWEREVVGDTAQQVDAVVQGLIDWLVEHDLRTWQAVTDLVRRRQAVQPRTETVGEVSQQFAYERQNLLNSVGARAQEIVKRYNAAGEAQRLSQDVQTAVVQAGLVQVGAVGLGTAVVVVATTAFADVTGILAATVMAALGFVILPARRRKAERDFHARTDELRTRLVGTLREQFDEELAQSLTRIREAVAPYTRFVRAEAERMGRVGEELSSIAAELVRIRYAIDVLMPELPDNAPPSSASPFDSPIARNGNENGLPSRGQPPGVPTTATS